MTSSSLARKKGPKDWSTAPTLMAGLKRHRISTNLAPRKKAHYSDDGVVGDSDDELPDDESHVSDNKHAVPGSDFDNEADDEIEPETPLACPLDTVTLTKICALAERLQISELRKSTLHLLAQRLGHDMETPLQALMYVFKRAAPSEEAESASGLLSLLISFVVLICDGKELVQYHKDEAIPADLLMALIASMAPLRVSRSGKDLKTIWLEHYHNVT